MVLTRRSATKLTQSDGWTDVRKVLWFLPPTKNCMKTSPWLPVVFAASAVFGLPSCAGLRSAGQNSIAAVRTSTATAFAKLPKLPDLSLANLLPGPGIKVVEVREKDLQDLPTGHERALAYESGRKSGFWIFGGPVDFVEPILPQPGSELDGSLLPPRIP